MQQNKQKLTAAAAITEPPATVNEFDLELPKQRAELVRLVDEQAVLKTRRDYIIRQSVTAMERLSAINSDQQAKQVQRLTDLADGRDTKKIDDELFALSTELTERKHEVDDCAAVAKIIDVKLPGYDHLQDVARQSIAKLEFLTRHAERWNSLCQQLSELLPPMRELAGQFSWREFEAVIPNQLFLIGEPEIKNVLLYRNPLPLKTIWAK